MKNVKLLLVVLLAVFMTCGLFANGLSLNGIGSKASAMGTAFIGLADDFSAVFFNPAGLTQMEQGSLSVFVTSIFPSATYNFELGGITMADTSSVAQGYPSGAIAYYKPVSDKLIIGIAGYVPSGVGSEWSGDELSALTGGTSYKWNSKLFMISLSPVAALKLSDKFSIGASLNINYVNLEMHRPAGDGISMPFLQYEESTSGIAIGATFGAMYKPCEKFSIGMVYKLPVNATINGTADAPYLANFGMAVKSDGERKATWPMFAGIGIAIKPTEEFTIIADVIYTNWEKLENIPITYDEPSWKSMEAGSEFTLRWEDTFDFKIGIEYKVSDSFFFRAGFYTDNAPSPDETINIMLPEVSYTAYTIGFGYKKGKISLDFALEYLNGNDRLVDPMNYLVGTGMPGYHGMKMVVPNVTFSVEL